jgi:hypothetical protein
MEPRTISSRPEEFAGLLHELRLDPTISPNQGAAANR